MIEVEQIPGEWLGNYVKRVKEQLKQQKQDYTHIRFNGIDIMVSHDSNVDDISTIYNLKGLLEKYTKS